MLFDIIDTYDKDTKQALKSVRQDLVTYLNAHEDPKKIVTFLIKCAIIHIDDQHQSITLGVPNEFVLNQVKKFFKKSLLEWVHETYNINYTIEFIVYPELHQWSHELHVNMESIKKSTKSSPSSPPPPQTMTRTATLDSSTKSALEDYFWILFEKKYTFDNFIVWATNELAASAAQAIAEKPGEVYNPFFIYGNVWLWKTHLMQSIWNKIIASRPELVIVYLPCTKLIDKIVHAVRFNKLDSLKKRLEQVDVLMIDDIQFLAGKEKTQEIFHNIFNDFTAKQKQIVITSDQSPKSLTLLEARLQSRFSLGLVVDIKAPDLETRMAIIDVKAQKKNLSLTSEIIETVARSVTTNVRELEWVVNILATRHQMLHKELTLIDVHQALETLWIEDISAPAHTTGVETETHVITPPPVQSSSVHTSTPRWTSAKDFDQIIATIASYFGVRKNDLTGELRNKEISYARQIAMYIAKTEFHRSLQKIGNYFWGKNHSSVIYSLKTCEKNLKKTPRTQELITQFLQK